jgi:hypothetical protein
MTMRIFFGVAILISALGMASAQDTNFASGPQYLINQTSGYASSYSPITEAKPNGSINYGPADYGTSFFLRPISTPSLSFSNPRLEVGASNATGALIAGAENQVVLPASAAAEPKFDLFPILYGQPAVQQIEISYLEASNAAELPRSISEDGVDQMTTARALELRGYGITLAQAASYSKAHAVHATHSYTNADIERLHAGSS